MTNKEIQDLFCLSFRHARRKKKQFKTRDYDSITISDAITISAQIPLLQEVFLESLDNIIKSI